MALFPNIINDLDEIPGDLMESAQTAWFLLNHPEEAPPSIRSSGAAIAILGKKGADDKWATIGTFDETLLGHAERGELECQVLFKRWADANPGKTLQDNPHYSKLYHADGKKKSLMDLSVLPYIFDDYKQESINPIRKIQEREAAFRQREGIAELPPTTKFSVERDRFRHPSFKKSGISVKKVRDYALSILNPSDKTKRFERAVHYTMQLLATVLVLASAIAAAAAAGPFVGVATLFVATFLAKWCDLAFATFSAGETVIRNKDWATDPERAFSKKWTWKKVIKSALLTASLLTGVVGSAVGSWFLVMGIAQAAGIAGAGLLLAPVAAIAAVTAGVLALGSAMAQHYFWHIGPNYKQIDTDHPDYDVSRLNILTPETPEQGVNKHSQKDMSKLEKDLGVELTADEKQTFSNTVNHAFQNLRTSATTRKVAEAPPMPTATPAANEEPSSTAQRATAP